MIFPGLPNLWDPLNVSNLAKDWPRWRLSFEILIVAACNNDLEDRQKLAIFLHCLGRNGREIIIEWFPQLLNFNCLPAKEVTFGVVWNRMNAHCQTLPVDNEEPKEEKPKVEEKNAVEAVEPKIQPPPKLKELVVVEEEIDENVNVEEVLENFNREINGGGEVYPLCLRDLEQFVKRYPRKRWIVNEYLQKSNELIIDAWTISEYPFEGNRDLYAIYGRVTTNLKFHGGSSKDVADAAEWLSCFKNLSALTLTSVRFPKDASVEGLPRNLRILHVEDCDIDALYPWLEMSKLSLQSLRIEKMRVKQFDFERSLSRPVFERLKSMIVIECDNFYLHAPALDYLYYNAEGTGRIQNTMHCTNLKTLVMKKFWKPDAKYHQLIYYPQLEHLTIIGGVSKENASLFESLNLTTLKVNYCKPSKY